MPRILDLPKHQRPREKLIEKGVENLKDKELLAILLRTGREGKNVLEVASEVLKKYPMKKLVGMKYEEMVEIKGIGRDKACTLLSAFELSKRALEKFDNSLPLIDSPQKAVDQLTEIRNRSKEYFVCLYLNARNQMVYKETISVGTINTSLVHPREVFLPAIKHSGVNLILAHNHPSGDLEKSPEDLAVTRRLTDAGELLGIEVMDHLIVTKAGFVSFKEQGWL